MDQPMSDRSKGAHGLKALQETGTGWVALRARELLGG